LDTRILVVSTILVSPACEDRTRKKNGFDDDKIVVHTLLHEPPFSVLPRNPVTQIPGGSRGFQTPVKKGVHSTIEYAFVTVLDQASPS
jgi:hypothetical protein